MGLTFLVYKTKQANKQINRNKKHVMSYGLPKETTALRLFTEVS